MSATAAMGSHPSRPTYLSRSAFSHAAKFACGALLLSLSSLGVHAGIVCKDGYQNVHGREISTPYCNDNYIAEVARLRGGKVSDAEVRNNPATRDAICRRIGYDTRIMEFCDSPGARNNGR